MNTRRQGIHKFHAHGMQEPQAGAVALDSDDEGVNAEEMAGNLMGDISRHNFSQSTFSQSNVPNCTIMKDIMYVNDLNWHFDPKHLVSGRCNPHPPPPSLAISKTSKLQCI